MLFASLYNILKTNIYSPSYKLQEHIFVAKDLKLYKSTYWLYIKAYNSGTFSNYLTNININEFYLIFIFRIILILILCFFIGFRCSYAILAYYRCTIFRNS